MTKKVILWPELKKAVYCENFNIDDIKDNELLIETAYSSVSPGTEFDLLDSIVSHKLFGVTFPFVPGYAASGVIIAVGKEIKNYQVGDRVVCNNAVGCHSSHVTATEDHVFKIPDNVSLSDAAFFNLCMTSIHCVRLSEARLGEPLVIIGQGPIGNMATQAAKACGAYPIITLDLEADRREASLKAGADYSVDPRNEEEYNRVMSLIGGGSSRVIDLSGTSAGMKQALITAAPLATVVYSSATMGPQTIEYGQFFVKGITLKSAFVGARLKESYDDIRNFFLLASRNQISAPDYSNEIYDPKDASQVYEKIISKDRTMKNPIFKWSDLN